MALLEALLLGGHTWQVVCTVVFQVSGLYYGSRLVMVGWVASLVVIADGAASTELSSTVLFVHDMYVLLCAVRLCFCRVYVYIAVNECLL